MESKLEQEAKAGEQVQQNPTWWNVCGNFFSFTVSLFSLMHLSGVATKCLCIQVYSCFDIMDALILGKMLCPKDLLMARKLFGVSLIQLFIQL